MFKKNLLLISTLLIYPQTNATFTINESPYIKEAHIWKTSYLCDQNNNLLITQQDLILIANLCYFSFMRSYYTLKAQDIALNAVSSIWKGWQNIAQTRLDPSHKTPYEILPQNKNITGDAFWKIHDEHRIIGTTYAHATQTIVHNRGLTTLKATLGVDDLRSRSRAVMAQALIDIRTYLKTIFKTEPTKGFMDIWKGFSFIQHLASYIPQLALSSFASAEELNNTVGDTGWNALESVQSLGAQTWKALEEARASFYLAHYEVVSQLLETHKLTRSLMFDANGLIPEKKQTKKLPVHLLHNTTEKK